MSESKTFAVYVKTKNDVNGNPRRGWLVYKLDSESEIGNEQYVDFVVEGYRGSQFVRTMYPDVITLSGPCGSAIEVTPKFFREVKRLGVD